MDDFGNSLHSENNVLGGGMLLDASTIASEGWANEHASLPVLPCSFVSNSASLLQQCKSPVAFPQRLGEVGRSESKKAVVSVERASPQLFVDSKRPRPIAKFAHTKLFQSAFSTCHELTTIQAPWELPALERAETTELRDAAEAKMPIDDTLPPRSLAFTVLCCSTSDVVGTLSAALDSDGMRLLDAASYLASECTDVPATRSMRVAFLHSSLARRYAETHTADARTSKSTCLHAPTNEVCLSIVERCDDGLRSRSEFAQIARQTTASEYVRELKRAFVEVCTSLGQLPASASILKSCPQDREIDGAFARASIKTAHEFWSLVEKRYEPILTDDSILEFSNMWAKVVPKTSALDGPDVAHGLLLHRQGQRQQAREHISKIKTEELAKDPPPPCFGLREPLDSAEARLGLHLLLVSAEEFSLGTNLSLYSHLVAPGKSLNEKTNGKIVGLAWRVMPLSRMLTDRVFVLPAHEEDVFATSLCQTNWPLRESTTRAVRGYRHVLEFVSDELPIPPAPTREPTAHEQILTTLLGLPLTCSAFRLGDVLSEIQGVEKTSPLVDFLVAATAVVGVDSSVCEAFVWGAKGTKRERSLQAQIDALKSRPPSRPRLNAPVEKIAEKATMQERVAILRAWSCGAEEEVRVLASPISGGSVKGVLAQLAPEKDATFRRNVYRWAKANLEGTDVERLSTLYRKVHSNDDAVLVVSEDSRCEFVAIGETTASLSVRRALRIVPRRVLSWHADKREFAVLSGDPARSDSN